MTSVLLADKMDAVASRKQFGSTVLLAGLLTLISFVAGKLSLALAYVNPRATTAWPYFPI